MYNTLKGSYTTFEPRGSYNGAHGGPGNTLGKSGQQPVRAAAPPSVRIAHDPFVHAGPVVQSIRCPRRGHATVGPELSFKWVILCREIDRGTVII